MGPWRRRGGATVLPPAPDRPAGSIFRACLPAPPLPAPPSGWGVPSQPIASLHAGLQDGSLQACASLATCRDRRGGRVATGAAARGGCHGKPIPPLGLENACGEGASPSVAGSQGPAPGQASRSSHRPPRTRPLARDGERALPPGFWAPTRSHQGADFCRLRQSAPLRVSQSPNPAALPASMGRNSEGRRRVIERKGRRGPRTRGRSQAVAGCRLPCAPCAGTPHRVSRRTTGAAPRPPARRLAHGSPMAWRARPHGPIFAAEQARCRALCTSDFGPKR